MSTNSLPTVRRSPAFDRIGWLLLAVLGIVVAIRGLPTALVSTLLAVGATALVVVLVATLPLVVVLLVASGLALDD